MLATRLNLLCVYKMPTPQQSFGRKINVISIFWELQHSPWLLDILARAAARKEPTRREPVPDSD